MAEIVNSLFGLDRLGIEQQIRQEQDAMARTIAQGGIMPSRNYTGAILGQQLGSALAKGLFGVEDPRLAKAAKLEAAMQQVNSSLTEEDRANPANVYFKLSQTLAQDPDLQNEAMMAQQKAQELGLQFEEKQAVVQQKQAAAAKAQQEAEGLRQQQQKEEDLRTALLALPQDADDDAYYNVVRRFAPSKDIMAAIDKRTLAREARQAKSEELQTKLDAELQRSRERNDTLLQQARLQGANATILESIRQQGRIELEAIQAKNEAAIEQIKAQNKALNAGVPKDVAEASAQIAGLDVVSGKINNWKTKLDKGEIIFSPKENAIATASLTAGFPTSNALAQNEVKRVINEGVNELLLKAKGTQTEGDAQRARELYIDAASKNSTEAWKAAMNALLEAQNKLKVERTQYIKTRGFADKIGTTSSASDPLEIRNK